MLNSWSGINAGLPYFYIRRFVADTVKFKKEKKPKPAGYWNNKDNVVEFLGSLQKSLNLKTIDDWNSITKKQILSYGGSRLFKTYSLYDLKCIGYPEGKDDYNVTPKTDGFWDDKDNVIQFLLTLKGKYNFKTADDWNLLSKKIISSNGGSRLFSKYSIFDLKCLAYPEGKSFYDPPIKINNRKPPKPNGYWDNKENILQFLEDLKIKLNLKTPEDWNLITSNQIRSFGGVGLLKKHSIYQIKCIGCPEGKLIFEKAPKPSQYWNDKENVVKFLDKLKEKYNLESFDDWNSITKQQIILNGGNSLFQNYSIYDLKCLGYPNGKLMFNSSKPVGFWDDKLNVKQFLEQMKEKYNLNTPNDWNLLTNKKIKQNGGSRLLQKYSIFELKCLGCPEGKLYFNPSNKPIGFWDNEENILQFLEDLKIKLNLKTPEDWNRLSKSQIESNGGNILVKKYSMKQIIEFMNPNEQFSRARTKVNKRSSQRWLFLQIQKLFPGEEIVEDYFHSEISRETGSTVQFDIFLINRNLAIEYHGKHHYEDIPTGFSPVELYRNRDREKEKLCEKFGVKLVAIPYWWDNQLDSLRATLSARLNEPIM